MDTLIQDFFLLLPALLATATLVLVLLVINFFITRNTKGEKSVSHQTLLLVVTLAGILVVIFNLPISETSRGQLLSLIGIVTTAVIALSSTTFVANVMAGLMLRAVNSFRPGDFVRVQDYFGRVTERGIFHTEIQTEDRDLATVPNLFLVTNPVTVVHDSGTIISAHLSLGYDVSHARVEELLKTAADDAGLEDAFVLIGELGDFSVSYRVGGFSSEVSRLLTTKSNLRKHILDVMHEAGIEIVSPNFMNQRVLGQNERTIPKRYQEKSTLEVDSSPEDVIFDKADSAAERETLKEELSDLKSAIAELETKPAAKEGELADDPSEREAARETLFARAAQIEAELSDQEE